MNNCTCNKNDELRIVRGNAFSLRLTVRALRIDGTPVEDFDLSQANAVLKVEHLGTKTEKTFTVIDNDSVIGFDNTLALGWYGLEMTGSYNDAPWRWYVEKVFCIVETNAKANIPAWAILTDDTYMIDVNTSITSGDIYQSDWAETNPQSPSYIQNKPNVVTHEEYDPTIIAINKAISDEETRAKAAEKANADDIADIEALIPAQATQQNQLADKQYVDDGISTASATYRGAYNLVSDLELTTAATEQQIAAALATKMTALGITPDNNDYCFVQVPTADATPTEIARVDRYKYNGTAWAFEFSLNNSGFTAAQWAALNSGITSGLVAKLGDLPTNSELTTLLGGKEDKSNKVTSLSAESTDTQYPSAKCVYDLHKANADDIDDIEALIPAQATTQNQLADKQYVDDGISTASATYRGAYNLVSDLELTVAATEQQIAAALATKMTALGITPDNNDYCFVQVPTADAMPTEIARVDRYKYNGTAWAFEFSLNNSGFTAAQWAALNSGITSGLVTKLSDLPTNSELTTLLGGKEDKSNKVTSLRAESTDTQYPSAKCVYDLHKANADDIDAIEEKIPSGASSSNKMATASDITNLSDSIAAILLLIPSAASSLNQLADKSFVNSSIATNTATYRGSYNLVSDLSLTISATEQQIAAALATKMTALSITPENNDYCFVQVPTADATPTEISRIDRYKYNGTAWLYEYSLNNSSFTSAQWAAINSGITSALVAKLSALPTNADLTTALGVLTDGIAAINAKIPSAATSSNKLVDNTAMQSYVAQIVNALDATFNITSSDGHVTVQITQTNGVITALAITTSDIASAAALNLLSGRVTTAEGNISTNATDIANLQQLYNNLQQSDPIIIEPTDTWPVANPSTHDIYRVIDRVNTPPQYYSDYMWNGTTMVLMAQYDNAIDDEPTPGSNNLVKSGGVAANIVYDISRAHASGSTLATYADLAAALGTNGANVPAEIRRGGMRIQFVRSSDNKYVQYRLMSDTFNTTPANWQGVDDEPTAGSDNLLKSGGVADVIGYKNRYVSDGSVSGYFDTSDGVTPVADSSYRTTDYIPLTNKTFKRGWGVGYVYLYDSNKQYLGYRDFIYTQLIEIDIAFSFVRLIFPVTTPQEDVYILYSDYSTPIQEQLDNKVEGSMSQTLGNSKTAVVSQNVTNNIYEELKSFTQIVGFNTKENVYEDSISGYLNTSDGVSVVSDSGYRTTDFIEIHSPVVRRNWYGGYVYYYDSSKHYLGYIDLVGSEDDEHNYLINTKVFENAAYLRLVFYSSLSENSVFVEYNRLVSDYLSVQINSLKKGNGFMSEDVRIICIGDSITHGDYGSNPPRTPNDQYECYPYFITAILGETNKYKRGWVGSELNSQDFRVMNLGVDGATPKSWYNSYWSAYSFLFDEANNEKIFVPIMFGANCEFTDTVDTDTSSSDTEIGYYKRIIENVMSLSGGKAQIVLLPPTFADPIRMPGNSHNAIIDNPIVQKLARFYNLPFIDTYYEMGISSINTNVYQPIDGLHLGELGYSKLGSFLLSKFNSLLSYEITNI